MNGEKIIRTIAEVREALILASDYFGQRSDVIDGPNGQPEPNEEMTLLTEVEAAFERLDYLQALILSKGLNHA